MASIADLRFLLSRVRFDWLPEEQGGLAPFGPTGIRRNQGFANHSQNPLAVNWWFGAGDTLFPRLTYNRLTAAGGKSNDVISSPFSAAVRAPSTVVTLGTTTVLGGRVKDALNPRILSNLIADSSNPIGFSSLNPADPNYAKKQLLKLQDNPTGRISPTSGAVNPLPYSNFMAQLGQFFDHGLDFVDKGGEGVVDVKLLPSDGLYGTTGGKAQSMFASRSKTVTVNWGSGSTDSLLTKMGIDLASQDTPSWDPVSTITTPGTGGYVGRLVLNSIIIDIQAPNIQALVTEINDLVPTTGVTVSAIPFPTIPGVTPPGSYQLTFTPTRAESFNQASAFIDNSQNIGSDDSRTVFLREYLDVATWKAQPGNAALTPTWNELITGRLLNSGATVNGETKSGVATWALLKANATKPGITLHDADQALVPLVALDGYGSPILGADGMPQLLALNKVTGDYVYVKDTDLARDPATLANPTAYVLATTRHAWLNDKRFNWQGNIPGVSFNTNPAVGSVRDLVDPSILNAHFVSGDGRMNENIGLTQIHEVFLNEHNRVFSDLKASYGFTGEQPSGGWIWTDPLTNVTSNVTGEDLFQMAKLKVEMIYQHMIFTEFNRKLSPNIAGFAGVNPLIDASISSEFANCVYRLGHSMLPEALGMRQLINGSNLVTTAGSRLITVNLANHGLQNGKTITITGVDLAIGGITPLQLNGTFTITRINANSFSFTSAGLATSGATGLAADKIQVDFDTSLIAAFTDPQSYLPGATAGQIAQGSSNQVGMRIDEKITDALRDNLLGQPLDLATLNLVRGRDSGQPTLNEMRAAVQPLAPALLQPTLNPYNSWTSFRNALKGSLDDQNATVKNFMMGYAADDLFTKFGAAARSAAGPAYSTYTTLAQWYALRESTIAAEQTAYMNALKAAATAAFANPTWMGTGSTANKDYNSIDAWIGGLAEREVVGGMLGPLFDAVFAMQNMALQAGDNFYYLGRIAGTEFFNDGIDGTLMADLVMRNTGAKNLYSDIFSVPDQRVEMADAGQPARVTTLADLQSSTTPQQVFDAAGNLVFASIGRSGYVGTTAANQTYVGNPGSYVDARGVLNPNGIGNASEVIVGSALADVISGGGGNDAIYGEAGSDTINGDSGVDFIHAGDGNDVIDGGAENDLLYGELGNDIVRGGIGADLMFGSEGNDTMYGGLDADLMNGGVGDDLMYGGDGIVVLGVLDPEPAVAVAAIDDVMHGSEGNDTMYGGGGWDKMLGESGHDILVPGTGGAALGGRDNMDGGYGDDIYIVESGALFNFEDFGDTGLTQLELVNKGRSFRVGNGLAIDEVRFTQTVAQDIVIAAVNNLGVVQIFSGIERLVIGTGLLTAADRTGLAAINIDASLANVGLSLGLEILGNAGANVLIGTTFDDIIDGGAGADAMEGTLGNDIYIVDNAADVIIELGGGGTDSVIVDAAVNYTLAADLENLTLRNVGALQGSGNNLDNTIIGNASANTLLGLLGNDLLDGAGGNDAMNGGAGFDTMTGGAGADRFVFGSDIAEIGNNPLFLETITDFLTGTDKLDFSATGYPQFAYIGAAAFSAANQLRFNAGVLYGNVDVNLASDFQIGMTGVATLAASDIILAPITLSLSGPIAGINEGNAGTTAHTFTARLSTASLTNTTFTYAVTGNGVNPANAADFSNGVLPTGTGTILAGQTSSTINVLVQGDTTFEQDETFQMTLSNPVGVNANFVMGSVIASSTIINDEIPGQVINGAAGNDSINGAAGDDFITGGAGRDTLTGGLGNDRFIYVATTESPVGNTRDTITDFNTLLDKIDVAAIDANTGVNGNQAFTFIGAAAFSALGQIRYVAGLVQFNNTGNNNADMEIALTGNPALAASGFIL